MSIINTVLSTYNILVDKITKIVKIGTSSNHTKFDDNGRAIAYGNARLWDDLIPTYILGTGSLTPPNLTLVGNNKCYGFPTTGTDELNLLWEITHNMVIGQTAVDVHFHYVLPVSADNKNFKFDIEILKLPNGGSAYTTAIPLTLTIPVMASNAKKMAIGVFTTTLDISDLDIGDQIVGRFIRDNTVANNLAESVGITQVAMHVLFDTLGSDNRTSKTIGL